MSMSDETSPATRRGARVLKRIFRERQQRGFRHFMVRWRGTHGPRAGQEYFQTFEMAQALLDGAAIGPTALLRMEADSITAHLAKQYGTTGSVFAIHEEVRDGVWEPVSREWFQPPERV